MWLEQATKLRQLLNRMYDVIDKQLVGGASENHVTPNNASRGMGIYSYNACAVFL